MSKWHYYSILLLSLALLVILWQSSPNLLKDEIIEEKTTTDNLYPDAYLINTKTTQYNEEGKLYYILKALNIHYFTSAQEEEDNYALMNMPDMQFYNREVSGDATWNISAAYAKSDIDGNIITLDKNVVLTQKNHEDQDIEILAHDLLIKTTEQYARTRKPVIIKTPSSTTTAVGLEVSLDRETVKLLSKVKSLYEPR